ncbi:MAG: hypothetical protein IPL86_11980 [Flavobacteriales bacterium]|nr:hypothetical protein [Flavobacteriales bacterium]
MAQDPFHTNLTLADGLPSNQVYCALEDHEGFLWFGTDAGWPVTMVWNSTCFSGRWLNGQ